ncbi:hypothetical protein SMSP2_01966 [Limihaloglobus sulfuriphilus]|uniref:Uncharacterized protein n=1 Tax=Limihaloglobus sulfuriphilus TaxID=1851148 RepID=A0A1Q2MFY5_9BACT|nr:hypothetical protein [Limihaloglobus sulfuriphilus]AQQ71590.1 hypothetical protein SMSP2_01966 [Limihaloglobus sulfuriphilus]
MTGTVKRLSMLVLLCVLCVSASAELFSDVWDMYDPPQVSQKYLYRLDNAEIYTEPDFKFFCSSTLERAEVIYKYDFSTIYGPVYVVDPYDYGAKVWATRLNIGGTAELYVSVNGIDWHLIASGEDYGPAQRHNISKIIGGAGVVYVKFVVDPVSSHINSQFCRSQEDNPDFETPNVYGFEAKVVHADNGSCQREYYLSGDVNHNCRVELGDFAGLARSWMECNDPFDPFCNPNYESSNTFSDIWDLFDAEAAYEDYRYSMTNAEIYAPPSTTYKYYCPIEPGYAEVVYKYDFEQIYGPGYVIDTKDDSAEVWCTRIAGSGSKSQLWVSPDNEVWTLAASGTDNGPGVHHDISDVVGGSNTVYVRFSMTSGPDRTSAQAALSSSSIYDYLIYKPNVYGFRANVVQSQPQSCLGGNYLDGEMNKDCRVDTEDLMLMAQQWGKCNNSSDPECGDFIESGFYKAKTMFQTTLTYSPKSAISTDAMILHGHGLSWDYIETAINSWQQNGYSVGRMFFSDSDAGSIYTSGEWDGREHTDDIETDRGGGLFSVAGTRYYMTPTDGWTDYLEDITEKSLNNAGADAILPEEPLAHLSSGYEQSFKDIWVDYYNRPWEAGSSSLSARFDTGQLKCRLYEELLKKLYTRTKDIAREKNQNIPFVIPIHSMYSNVAAGLVAPLGRTTMQDYDGYIGQIWTGPINWSLNQYNGYDQSFFSSAFALYDYFTQLSVASDRKLWLLVDPVEDDPSHTWESYEGWYKHSVAALLSMDEIDSYEIMPWPERVFEDGFAMGGGVTPGPEDFRILVLTITQVLQEIQKGGQWHIDGVNEPTQRIGAAVADTMMWQTGGYPRLQNAYGLLIPLIQKGVPISSFVMERAGEPEYLSRFDVIVLSYEHFKPRYVSMNNSLVNWVKSGGVLVVLGSYGDSIDTNSRYWWEKLGYGSALEHLIDQFGGSANQDNDWQAGEGWVLRRQVSPGSFASSSTANNVYLPLLNSALAKIGRPAMQTPGFFRIDRGPFVIAHSISNPVSIQGRMVDIFSPALEVVTDPIVTVGSSGLYRDVTSQLQSGTPAVLHATHRLMSQEYAGNVLRFTLKGPDQTPAVARVAAPYSGIESNINVTGSDNQPVSFEFSDDGDTFSIKFNNDPDGAVVEIEYPQ